MIADECTTHDVCVECGTIYRTDHPGQSGSCASCVLDRYRALVVPQPHVSVAESLLAYWDHPWSPTAKRFAYHALRRALSRGIDVLNAATTGETT